jgi:hypothetical protein
MPEAGVAGATASDNNTSKETAMLTRYAVAALAVAAFVTPALAAEFYIVQDASTKRCQIVEQRPTSTTTTIVGGDKVYTTRTEAESALGSVQVCHSTGSTGSSSTTTTTTVPR